MKYALNARRTKWLEVLVVLALSALVAGAAAAAAPPRINESELSAAGFKVLVATTSVQKDWVKKLPPGQIRPMQRNGKKYFIYPDAPRNQIYVGGPNEYAAYQENHPEIKQGTQEAANKGTAYRSKQVDVMREATARDNSNPFLGVSWADLGW